MISTDHETNLARLADPALRSTYQLLASELGAGFLECGAFAKGFIPVLRFSRGSWHPLDFIVNRTDLRCYFRSPLLKSHPQARELICSAFPEAVETEGQLVFNFSDSDTARRLVTFVEGRVREYAMRHLANDANLRARKPTVSVAVQEVAAATADLYWEGSRVLAVHEQVERNRNARDACLAIHGTTCFVCGTSPGSRYRGMEGRLTEVHHLIPVAMSSGTYAVNPGLDLIPVCPNCHRAIHTRVPALSPAEVQELLAV
jgi:hypothetical protein